MTYVLLNLTKIDFIAIDVIIALLLLWSNVKLLRFVACTLLSKSCMSPLCHHDPKCIRASHEIFQVKHEAFIKLNCITIKEIRSAGF